MSSLKELRAMQAQELLREAEEVGNKLQKVRIEVALGKEKNTAKCRRLQQDHARIRTVLREKELQNGQKGAELQNNKKSRTLSSSSS